MKSIIKKNIDAMAEAKKYKKFQELSEDVDSRLRLAVEIYKERERMCLSQQDLAKKINSTQKVISRVENGDVNVGLDLVNRISSALSFTVNNWSRIYNFSIPEVKIILGIVAKNSGSEPPAERKEIKEVNTSNSYSFNK